MQAKKWKLARGFAYPVIDVLCAPFGHCFLCKHVLEFHCAAALLGSWEADDDTIDLEERRKKIRALFAKGFKKIHWSRSSSLPSPSSGCRGCVDLSLPVSTLAPCSLYLPSLLFMVMFFAVAFHVMSS